MFTKKNVRVTCEHCGNVLVSGKEIAVIYNSSYVDYTYAFMHCGVRQVDALSPDDAVLLLRAKAQFIETSKPKFSHRVGGEPIDEIDLADFRASLNMHDHLAAYA